MRTALAVITVLTCAVTPAGATTLFSNESLFESASSSLIVIDFSVDGTGQTLSHGVIIDDEYSNLGVTFSGNPGFPRTNILNEDVPTNGQGDYSGGNFLESGPYSRAPGPFEIAFATPIQTFSFWLGDIQDLGTSSITAYYTDETTEVIDLNPTTGDGPFVMSFFGVLFDSNVDRIGVTFSSTDHVFVDDIAFGSAASVDLPPHVFAALTALGLLAVHGFRKQLVR